MIRFRIERSVCGLNRLFVLTLGQVRAGQVRPGVRKIGCITGFNQQCRRPNVVGFFRFAHPCIHGTQQVLSATVVREETWAGFDHVACLVQIALGKSFHGDGKALLFEIGHVNLWF